MIIEQKEFDEKYNKMCYYIYEQTQDPREKECLVHYLMGLHKTQEKLEWLQQELNISVSDIIRMAIPHFAKYVKKVSK